MLLFSQRNIIPQSLHPALATESALFEPAEGARRVEFIKGVRPDDAGLKLRGNFENLASLVGPDSGAESVAGVVGLLHRFGRRAESHDTEDRAEDLFPGDAMG